MTMGKIWRCERRVSAPSRGSPGQVGRTSNESSTATSGGPRDSNPRDLYKATPSTGSRGGRQGRSRGRRMPAGLTCRCVEITWEALLGSLLDPPCHQTFPYPPPRVPRLRRQHLELCGERQLPRPQSPAALVSRTVVSISGGGRDEPDKELCRDHLVRASWEGAGRHDDLLPTRHVPPRPADQLVLPRPRFGENDLEEDLVGVGEVGSDPVREVVVERVGGAEAEEAAVDSPGLECTAVQCSSWEGVVVGEREELHFQVEAEG